MSKQPTSKMTKRKRSRPSTDELAAAATRSSTRLPTRTAAAAATETTGTSCDADDGANNRTRATTRNPFLAPRYKKDNAAVDMDDSVLRNVLVFSKRIRWKGRNEVRTSDAEGTEEFNRAVSSLATFIEPSSSSSSSSLVTPFIQATHSTSTSFTRQEIAIILLPWGIQQLLSHRPHTSTSSDRSIEDALLWKVLANTLSLWSCSPDSAAAPTVHLEKFLSQSVLFKLVPKVAVVSVTTGQGRATGYGTSISNDETVESTLNHITTTYRLLLQRFTPTMEVACKLVLLPLLAAWTTDDDDDDDDTTTVVSRKTTSTTATTTGTAQHLAALVETMHWIHTILSSRKGNPKTTFQLLCEPTVLMALCRCHVLTASVPSVDDTTTATIVATTTTTTAATATAAGTTLRLNSLSVSHGTVVRDILWDGLFHTKHHMEGFVALLSKKSTVDRRCVGSNGTSRKAGSDIVTPEPEASLSKVPTSFKSYHEELLVNIAQRLSDASLDNYELIAMLPVLLRGFYQHSKEWDRQQRETAAKKSIRKPSSEILAPLQFELFRRWSEPLLRLTMDSPNRAMALQSLRGMLELLLEFDAYTPSHQDSEGGDEYSYLQSIASWLLPAGQASKDGCGNDMDTTALPELHQPLFHADSMRCVCLLVKLHHLLVHERIVDALLLCLQPPWNGPLDETTVFRIEFVTTVVDTYRRLRQQSFIFDSVLRVVSKCRELKAWNEISVMHSLFNDPRVSRSIATAFEASPIHETTEVLHIIDAWLNGLCHSSKMETDTDGLYLCLAFAARVCSMATRNAHVDRGTSSDIAKVCNSFMQSSISTLVEFDSGTDSTTMSTAVCLCGLVSELFTRCTFWLGRGETLENPPVVITNTLRSAVHGTVSVRSRSMTEGLIFLCSLRLKELHSLIHDFERNGIDTESNKIEQSALILEATKLVEFIADDGDDASERKGAQWIAVAQTLSSWIAYARRWHVRKFLTWVLSTVAHSSSAIFTSNVLPCEPDEFQEQLEVAKCLLADASFYQHEQVQSEIAFAGLVIAAEGVLNVIESSKTSNCVNEIKRALASSSDDVAWSYCSHKQIHHQMIESSEINSKIADTDAISHLNRVHRAILLSNGFPPSWTNELDAMKMMDLSLRLDHVCRSLLLTRRTMLPTLLPIITALRLSVFNLLGSDHADALFARLCVPSDAGKLSCGIIKSTICLFVERCAAQAQESQQLLFATGQAIKQLLARISITSMDVETAGTLSKSYSMVKNAAKSDIERHALADLTRSMLEGLRYSEWHDLYPDKSHVTTHLSVMCQSMLDLTGISVTDMEAVSSAPIKKLSVDFLLLVGDLTCVESVDWLPMSGKNHCLDGIQRYCLESLGPVQTERTRSASMETVVYLVGKLSFVRPSFELLGAITDVYTSVTHHSDNVSLLEASFCHTASILRGKDLETILTRLTANEGKLHFKPSSASPKLRLLKLLLRYIQDEEQIEIVSAHGRQILFYALKSLRRSTAIEQFHGDALVALNLLEDLIKRHDILPLIERELALILSYIVGVLGRVNYKRGVDATSSTWESNTKVYVCAADLLTILFQRNTKQLYACVPSVIAALHCFLRHAIYAPESLSELDIGLRGQRFTRLCELLVGHKEIYKKHVIGLVLEFVGALAESMSLLRRDSLVPAIYCLLDTMSKFEMEQLNAYMDSKAKILFRSIHQSYEKLHTYKGQ